MVIITVSLTHFIGLEARKFPPIIESGKKVKTNNPFDFSGVIM